MPARETTNGERQLYLEIRQAVAMLQSPALNSALNNKDLDAACNARHASAVQHALAPEQHHAVAQQQQRQHALVRDLGDLGSIEGGVLLTDIPAMHTPKEMRSQQQQQRHNGAAAGKIPRIGLGLGCPRVSEGRYSMMEYFTDTKGSSRDAMDSAIQALVVLALQYGYRLFDTAQMYLNEGILGAALEESPVARSEVFIITKLNNEDERFEALATDGDADWTEQHAVAVQRYVRKTVAEQLERLKTDYVDMYCKLACASFHAPVLPSAVPLRAYGVAIPRPRASGIYRAVFQQRLS